METLRNNYIVGKELTPLETLLAELIFYQLLQTAKQDMKERGFSSPYKYVTAILLEHYQNKNDQKSFKPSYNYKTRRNGNSKRKVLGTEN